MQNFPKISFVKLSMVLVSIILLFNVFKDLNIKLFIFSFTQVSLLTDLILVSIISLNILVISMRLYRLLNWTKQNCYFLNALEANICGMFSGLFFTNLFGTILGRHAILKKLGIKSTLIALISIYERAIMFLIGLVSFVLGVFWLFQDTFFEIFRAVDYIYYIPGIFIVLVANLLIFKNYLKNWGYNSQHLFLILKAISELSFYTLVAFFIMWLAFIVALHSFNSDIGLMNLIAASAIVSFIASLPISINGWGVREMSAVVVFGKLGVSKEDAVTISVLIGICSTFAIVLSSVVFTLVKKNSMKLNVFKKEVAFNNMVDFNSIYKIMSTFIVATLVFFQLSFNIGSSTLSLNLADPIASIAFFMMLINFISEEQRLVQFMPGVERWLVLISITLLFSFMNGYIHYGFIKWAFVNRLIGWFIILGYFSVGGFMVSEFGLKGWRILCEIVAISLTVCSIVAIVFAYARCLGFETLMIRPNFEAYSANRNTYTFQALMAISCSFVLSKSVDKSKIGNTLCIFMLVLQFYSIYLTASLAARLILLVLIMAAYILNFCSRAIIKKAFLLTVLIILINVLLTNLNILNYRLLSIHEDFAYIDPENLHYGMYYTEKLYHWESLIAGARAFMSSPIFGIGLGGFYKLGSQFSQISESNLVIHSVPIWLLAEFGLFGTLIIMFFPFRWFIDTLRNYRYWQNPRLRLVLLISACFCVMGMVHDLSYSRVFWLLLGGCLATPKNINKVSLIKASH